MLIHGWGRYPSVEAEASFPKDLFEFRQSLRSSSVLISRGLGRSYGDSSLASKIIDTRFYNRFISFDELSGKISCDAGVSFAEILENFVPKGWFLPVTPGTKYVTVGGAIASDVHGKNHHLEGTFSQHVDEIKILLGNGELVTASHSENPDLFFATCGGMGLTGIIVNATFRLKPILSNQILETTIKASSLDDVLEAFEENKSSTYSVAWIDCLAKGKDLGRSLLMVGEHGLSGELLTPKERNLSVPFDMPNILLSRPTIQGFNSLYYNRIQKQKQTRTIHYDPFFYPLDRLENWNRLYGKSGFIQYQFVLPKDSGGAGLKKIMERIAASGRGSFLAVLKVFGRGNKNILSFPIEGYTLALDFKAEPENFTLLDELDKLVLDYGGRHYLTKDARMSESTFKASYINWAEFEEVRARYHATGKFASEQSRRLGLK